MTTRPHGNSDAGRGGPPPVDEPSQHAVDLGGAVPLHVQQAAIRSARRRAREGDIEAELSRVREIRKGNR